MTRSHSERAFLGGVGWVSVEPVGELWRIVGEEVLYRRVEGNMLLPATPIKNTTTA